MIERILVPVDGSAPAMRAIEHAALLASRFGSEIILLHVRTRLGSAQIPTELSELARIEHIEASEGAILQRAQEAILESAAVHAAAKGAQRVRMISDVGPIADVIADRATSEGVDLIVLGQRGLGSLTGVLLGSVSQKVIHLAKCPCTAVP
jgi:nucleotide-binding universal stress UspA family protein